MITVLNKQDLLYEKRMIRDFHADYTIPASAKTGEGVEEIQTALEEILRGQKIYIERVYPYSQGGILQLIRSRGELVSEEYLPEGVAVKAYVPKEIYGKT